MASASRWLGLTIVLGASVIAVHCSSDDGGKAGAGGGVNVSDAGLDALQAIPDVMTVADGGMADYAESCGVVVGESCVPDDAASCGVGGAPVMGSGGQGAGNGGDGAGGASGAGGDGAGAMSGAGGASGEGGGGQGGDSASGGQGGSPSSGAAGAGEEPSGVALSCQVVPLASGPKAECRPAGTGEAKAPCFTSAQCQAGLACVHEGDAAAICLPFCCAGDDACTHGTYCAERPLADDPDGLLDVPVCVDAADCNLNEPYPCTGTTCSCKKEGQACMVVRADGTTTCADPGDGKVGDPCPCAWGYVCSQASEQCVLLCETARPEYYCGNVKCQASAELPEGWGVCVLPEPDAAAAR